MAANWINVRYKGTTPINVNFKTWYPNEIHAMPEGHLDEFRRIHGDVVEVLGPNRGDVPGEGPADQQWPYGPMTDAPMTFEPTPGDELTAVNVTLTNDAPPPASVAQAQEAAANPMFVQPQATPQPLRTPTPVEPAITDAKRAEIANAQEAAAATLAGSFVVRTTGEAPQDKPVQADVPQDAPPVKGEPRTGNELDEVKPGKAAKASK